MLSVDHECFDIPFLYSAQFRIPFLFRLMLSICTFHDSEQWGEMLVVNGMGEGAHTNKHLQPSNFSLIILVASWFLISHTPRAGPKSFLHLGISALYGCGGPWSLSVLHVSNVVSFSPLDAAIFFFLSAVLFISSLVLSQSTYPPYSFAFLITQHRLCDISSLFP